VATLPFSCCTGLKGLSSVAIECQASLLFSWTGSRSFLFFSNIIFLPALLSFSFFSSPFVPEERPLFFFPARGDPLPLFYQQHRNHPSFTPTHEKALPLFSPRECESPTFAIFINRFPPLSLFSKHQS